jgi:hypothetical protein
VLKDEVLAVIVDSNFVLNLAIGLVVLVSDEFVELVRQLVLFEMASVVSFTVDMGLWTRNVALGYIGVMAEGRTR